jgi:hypothetical protein
LLTKDEHLRSIDMLRLRVIMDRFELSSPAIATPREILRSLLR